MKRRTFLASTGVAATAAALPLHRSFSKNKNISDRPVLDARLGSKKGKPDTVLQPRRVLAGLEPYVPNPNQPWDNQRVTYLLHRLTFGATRNQVQTALQKSPGEVVDTLLTDQPLPSPPASWVNENYSYDGSGANQLRDLDRGLELKKWWISLMLSDTFSMREKMVLFWHDHFATEFYQKVRIPQYHYILHDTFRKNVFGNFKELVKKVTIDPCMLYYLDGVYSTKNRPNENYGRELLELFTMGEGSGYTEADIENGARALSGWTVKPISSNPDTWELQSTFVESNFDHTNKTYFGETANFGIANIPGVKNLIDKIFEQQAAAEFICRKIYREFVYEVADETIVQQMAIIFKQNNFEIKPVLSALFKSAHFFDDANIGSHISHPVEFAVGICRSLEMQITNSSDYEYIYNSAAGLGMQIFDPPNVKGWPGYRSWISSSLLPARYGISDSFVDGSKLNFKFNAKNFASAFPIPDDAEALVRAMAQHVLTLKLSSTQINMLVDKMLRGTDPAYWSQIWNSNDPSLESRLKDVLKAIFRIGENQLY